MTDKAAAPPPAPTPGKQLTPTEWDSIIEDFQSQQKWPPLFSSPLSLLETALNAILRKDFPPSSRTHLMVFIEENTQLLIPISDGNHALGSIVEALRQLIQSPNDGNSITTHIKEQMMVSMISAAIAADVLRTAHRHLESFVELLLTVINRPNHGPDRHSRGIACECLRELERAYPGLLLDVAGHIWILCQAERTHASQNYILLLTQIINGVGNVPRSSPSSSILATSVPLVPFKVPNALLDNSLNSSSSPRVFNRDVSVSVSPQSSKELRRVVAFLLEHVHLLAPFGLMEFMQLIADVVAFLGLQASLLKVQFYNLIHSINPILWHVVLWLFLNFPDAFEGDEQKIANRLVLIMGDSGLHVVYRILCVHWLMGLEQLCMERRKKSVLIPIVSKLYPRVFDPLALKALKLDVLAYCIIIQDDLLVKERGLEVNVSTRKVFEDALVCVSGYKWLPPSSTETTVAFRFFHKILTGATPCYELDTSIVKVVKESISFNMVQSMLVNNLLEFRRLVPVTLLLINRLLNCSWHKFLGESTLQALDRDLIPKLSTKHGMEAYFPIFDAIAENENIPPKTILEMLMKFVVSIVDGYSFEQGMTAWSQGSKVLSICRTMLMHHHSSRVFNSLSRLLSFMCMNFVDLEVRDNARIYLRALICIPGKKLKHILSLSEQLPRESYFHSHTPEHFHILNKSQDLSSWIIIDRKLLVLVKQSWSLAIYSQGIEDSRLGYLTGIQDIPAAANIGADVCTTSDGIELPGSEKIHIPRDPLRVMGSKISEILGILRRHFASIPDYRHMPGIRIHIPCTLKVDASPLSQMLGIDVSNTESGVAQSPLALYAVVITFSSSSQYGGIPVFRIPFLLSQSASTGTAVPVNGQDELAVVSRVGNEKYAEREDLDDLHGADKAFGSSVMIELEPHEPAPGTIEVSIEANVLGGQIIRGKLQNVDVGIEDMFIKAPLPSEIDEGAKPAYYSDLFHALWEACGSSRETGRETFPLKGEKGLAFINGTRSVKLMEAPSNIVIRAVEKFLAPFIVEVVGEPLAKFIKDEGMIENVLWKDEVFESLNDNTSLVPYSKDAPIPLKYISESDDKYMQIQVSTLKRELLGHILVLIFLPPRFHLLLRLEVSEFSTLARIRTDHWPCLAYIDEYLEALIMT